MRTNSEKEDLRTCLDYISRSAKAKAANIAKNLAEDLDNMFKSKQTEDFWQRLEKRQLDHDVKFFKEKHNKKLIVNVLREHNVVSGLVASETEDSIQQRCVSSNLSNDDLSEDYDLSDDDLPNDNNDDFSNSGKDNEYENEDNVDVADLRKPPVMEVDTGKVLTLDEWAEFSSPLFYHIVDHSGQHGPTTKLLNRYMSSMRRSLPNMSFDLPSLSAEQDKFFDKLLAAEDLQDVRASTSEKRNAKKLVDRINDSINCPNKDDIPEYEHTMRIVIPFIDASIRDVPDYVIRYKYVVIRVEILESVQMGYRVDVLVKFHGLYWSPDLGCGEISGGLPRCSSAKEWMDTLKLGWELRDVWTLTQDQLNRVDASALVVWGFTVVARTIRIYAFTAA
ncbi:14871_t:CDS:2, partial [Funneliformis mosseae]